MRNQFIVLGGLLGLLVAAAIMRWPRLEEGMVCITHSEVRGDQMVVEFRMTKPFEIAVQQESHKPLKVPAGTGIHVGGADTQRRGTAEFIPSKKDWLRGEHVVHVTFQRGYSLKVEANGRDLKFAPWTALDARSLKWLPPTRSLRFGDGLAKRVLLFAETEELEESLVVYAGTDFRKWVE